MAWRQLRWAAASSGGGPADLDAHGRAAAGAMAAAAAVWPAHRRLVAGDPALVKESKRARHCPKPSSRAGHGDRRF